MLVILVSFITKAKTQNLQFFNTAAVSLLTKRNFNRTKIFNLFTKLRVEAGLSHIFQN